MPYIKRAIRNRIDPFIDELIYALVGYDKFVEPGTLNYVLTTIVSRTLSDHLTYTELSSIMGVLETMKLEFQRRIVSPYEDTKIKENGDVYPLFKKKDFFDSASCKDCGFSIRKCKCNLAPSQNVCEVHKFGSSNHHAMCTCK